MNKETILGGAVLLIALGGILFYTSTKPSSVKAPGSGMAITLPGGSYVEHAAYYDIAANHASNPPLLSAVSTKADAAAITLMKQFVSDTIIQFKTDGNFENLTAADIQMMGLDQGRKEKLQINYLIASSPHTISYIFTIYQDTLGAHGNTTFKTFTFATDPSTSSEQAGAPLALADIFAPSSNYLETLSKISRAKLPALLSEKADANMIENGTTPNADNFSTFFFDNRDLVILFAPYQVASYAAGPQTLRIPVGELSSILKAEYR